MLEDPRHLPARHRRAPDARSAPHKRAHLPASLAADMVKFAFSFFDFDNDRTRTAQECVYVPEKAFCKLDENGECENNFGCKSGDTLGNLANGCAVGRNGKYAATGCKKSYHKGVLPSPGLRDARRVMR